MSTVLRPVGPEPPRVYWVRRVVVALAALVLVLGLALLLGRWGSGDGTTGDQPTAGPAADDGEAEEAEGSGAPRACEPGAVSVVVSTDGRTYAADAVPVLTVATTNTGDVPCTLDVGEGNVEVLVTSGSDRIWSNTDCGSGTERLLLLDPDARATTEILWPRERSDAECTAGLPEPRPGTYTVVATVGDQQSEAAVFELQ